MSKQEKFYCNLGQAIVEGMSCITIGLIFATMFVLRIIL